MKLKMLKSTRATNFGFLKAGEVVDVDDSKVAQRWISRGIAKAADKAQSRRRKAVEPVQPVQPQQVQTAPREVSDVIPSKPAHQSPRYFNVDESPEAEADTANVEEELDAKHFNDLRALAREYEVDEYGKMNKAELVEALAKVL